MCEYQSNPLWTILLDTIVKKPDTAEYKRKVIGSQQLTTSMDSEIILGTTRELVYVFGGLNKHRVTTNSMRIYQQRFGHLAITYPDVLGQPPPSRCDHNMIYVSQ